MPIISLPDGHNAEFPDTMSLDDIKAVIRKKYPPKNMKSQVSDQKNNPSFLEKAGNFSEQNINRPFEENVLNPLNSASAGFQQGIANIVPGLANLGISGINALGGNLPKVPMFNFAPNNISSEIGNIGSYFVGPGALKALGKLPEFASIGKGAMSIPIIANAISHAGNILTKSPLVTKVAGNALLGGAYSPDNQGMGMLAGGSVPLIGAGVGAAYNKLRPSNLLRGNLSPEQLQKNLEVTQGTSSSLGDVIGSPFLKRMYENVLSKIPLSGGYETMQKTAGQVIDKGHGILNKLLGNNKAEDFEQSLNDALQKAFSEHHSNKTNLYTKANELSDSIGLKLELPNFSNKSQEYADALENTNILKYEPEMASLINKLRNYKNPVKQTKNVGSLVDKEGSPLINETSTQYPTLKEANMLKGKLNQLADQYGSSANMTDRHAASVFRNLSSSLKSDIQSAINKSGHEDLKDAYNEAESNYAKNFSPFLDKEIYKFSTGNADPDMLISSFIKTGKANDRANLLSQLIDKLPSDKKNLLGYGYLSRALDENNVLNPLKVKTLLSRNSLGPRQFEALFPNKQIRNELNNLVDLTEKNTKALKIMQNPDTGQMNMDILPLLSKSKTGLLGKMLGAKPAVNWLTSEKTRQNLVKQMIENSK